MRQSVIVLLMLAMVMPLVGGCRRDYFYRAETPEAELEPVAQLERSDEGSRVVARLRLTNPNDRELRLLRLSYAMTIPNVGTFEIEQNPPVHLPAWGEQTIDLPAAFADPGGEAAERSWRVSGRITYEYDGEFRRLMTEAGLPVASMRFSGRGEPADEGRSEEEAEAARHGVPAFLKGGMDVAERRWPGQPAESR